MKKNIKNLIGFVNSYGAIKGLSLTVKAASNPATINVPNVKHPIHLRRSTSDLPTFLQVFAFGEYKINLDNPKVIIDAGANIGLFTIFIKSLYPNATVICIEPDPENYEALKNNIKPYPNVHTEHCGLWSKDATLSVTTGDDYGKWGIMVREDENGQIKATSIPSLMKKYSLDKIDVLKIDIETSEKFLFASNYESWLPKVKVLVIELHDAMLPGCSQTFFEAINKTIRYSMETKGENVIIKNLDLN
ncbi:MAG TPA: FkbM family methyltransferase [Flavisolibacter sp.]|nr:FkbM family methyltransferase [Flavisolibacter sp.]